MLAPAGLEPAMRAGRAGATPRVAPGEPVTGGRAVRRGTAAESGAQRRSRSRAARSTATRPAPADGVARAQAAAGATGGLEPRPAEMLARERVAPVAAV